jgi:hypothetical protein
MLFPLDSREGTAVSESLREEDAASRLLYQSGDAIFARKSFLREPHDPILSGLGGNLLGALSTPPPHVQ